MLEWEAFVVSVGTGSEKRWRIMHDGVHLDGTDYTTDALRSAHRWIANDPTVAGEFAEDVMKDTVDAGLLTSLTVTEITDFLIDWSSIPFN